MISSLLAFYHSSIGKKILVALTGLVLVVFVLGHMIGNLLVFAGPHALNQYGHMLHTSLHGAGVWIARIGIFGSIALHVLLTIQLTKSNREARAERYGKNAVQCASTSSRTMIWSGLTILVFFVYHILHYTARVGNDYNNPALYTYDLDGVPVHNIYKMVIDGFSWAPASVFYLIAMAMLCSHLSHGVRSIFQTLGLNTEKTDPLFKRLGWAYALLIFVGNAAIVLSIWLFGYGR